MNNNKSNIKSNINLKIIGIIGIFFIVLILKSNVLFASDGECGDSVLDINELITHGVIIVTPQMRGKTLEYEYHGVPIKPKVTLKIKDGTKLTEGISYKVEYTRNDFINDYAGIQIIGIGGFAGVESYTFKIKPSKDYYGNISFSQKSITIPKGQTRKIAFSTSKGSYGNITKTSNNNDIAIIKGLESNYITVYGHQIGTTSVNLKLPGGNYTSCAVTVSDYTDIKSIKFNTNTVYLYKGYSKVISYSANRSLIGNEKVTVYDKNVATISQTNNNVKINANNVGDTLVGVVAGGKTDYCTVRVREAPAVMGLTAKSLYLYPGETKTIGYKGYRNGQQIRVFGNEPFKLYNQNIANYSRSGLNMTITAKNPGKTVVAVAPFGGVCDQATCTVNVLKIPSGIHFSQTSKNIMVGQTVKIYYYANTNAGDIRGDEKVEIDKPGVASWTRNGHEITVTGKSEGTATVIVTAKGGAKAYCKITVKKHNASNIIESAKKINSGICSYKKYEQKYDYCDLGGTCRSNSNDHKHGHKCGLNDTFEQSKNSYHNTCCATFVSWILRDAGIIDKTIHGADSLASYLEGTEKFKVVNDIKAGDILCYNGHIEISAGGNKVYTGGDVDSINTLGPTKKENINPHTILRLK